MFFTGSIFQCTYNHDCVLIHYKLTLFYGVPRQIDLDSFQRIKILVCPPTITYDTFISNPDLPKDHYIQIGLKEVSIVKVPEQIVFCNDLKCILHQCGLRHYGTGNIHGAMGETYNRMAILLSDTEKLFSLWDRGQLIVNLSRTRIMKNDIFVGPKNETICGLKFLLNQITQWCDYIEEVMKITNFNPNINFESSPSLNQFSFSFRNCSIPLPQYQTGSVYF